MGDEKPMFWGPESESKGQENIDAYLESRGAPTVYRSALESDIDFSEVPLVAPKPQQIEALKNLHHATVEAAETLGIDVRDVREVMNEVDPQYIEHGVNALESHGDPHQMHGSGLQGAVNSSESQQNSNSLLDAILSAIQELLSKIKHAVSREAEPARSSLRDQISEPVGDVKKVGLSGDTTTLDRQGNFSGTKDSSEQANPPLGQNEQGGVGQGV